VIQFPLKIPVEELGGESKLFYDYVSPGGSPVRTILGGFGRTDPKWKQRIDAWDRSSQVGSDSWRRLVDHLVEYNLALGVADDVIEKLRRTADGDTRVVVTGQQPGALGGPLLTLYKAATAIAVAQYVEQNLGTPCVSLFWIGSDDVDFQEIREMFLVDCDLSPLSTSIDQSAYPAAAPVGNIPAPAVRHVWEAMEPIIARCPHGPFVSDLVRGALDHSADHGEIAGRIVSALNAGKIAFVDGREPAVRAHAKDLFLTFFDEEPKVRESIAGAGRTLEKSGYHAQLWLGPDSGVFMVEDGLRKKIVENRRAEARERMEHDVGRFSPGVALRNLVQDYVFQPIAVVLGPAEIAYRAQLNGAYDMMGVNQPVVFPRMPATYIAPFVAELIGSPEVAVESDVKRLLTDPDGFVKHVYSSQRTSGIDQAAERLKRTYRAGADDFLSAIRGALDGKSVDKSRKRLADLERRLDQALDVAGTVGKSVARSRWPFLSGLGEFMRRKDKPQERYLSLLTPFLFSGAGAERVVGNAAEDFVEGALDANTEHIVYSL
jgi:uncharacterized protein YllA (UPF0747 family)